MTGRRHQGPGPACRTNSGLLRHPVWGLTLQGQAPGRPGAERGRLELGQGGVAGSFLFLVLCGLSMSLAPAEAASGQQPEEHPSQGAPPSA